LFNLSHETVLLIKQGEQRERGEEKMRRRKGEEKKQVTR
jgi:hypothetical protein